MKKILSFLLVLTLLFVCTANCFVVNSYSYNNSPILKNFNGIPSQITQGKAYYIKGEIVSGTPITKVTINIFSRFDNARSLKVKESAYPNRYSYNLKEIDKRLHFTKYPAGDMEIQIWAVNSSGAHMLHQGFFKIVEKNSCGKISDVNAMIAYAETYVNSSNKYVYGANGEKNEYGGVNFDCSSFTQHVYGKYGVNLPRTSREQSQKGKKVNYTVNKTNKTISGLKKGDLLYFESPKGGHVEIYAGNNIVIHAKSTGEGIVKERMTSWECKYIKAVRRFD